MALPHVIHTHKKVQTHIKERKVSIPLMPGRELQRYRKGCCQVVGCIPYRYKAQEQGSLEASEEELKVMVISSQKGKGMLFPKGGWELDESRKEAAVRETMEEAGVRRIDEARRSRKEKMSM